jgi:hypothetical protein
MEESALIVTHPSLKSETLLPWSLEILTQAACMSAKAPPLPDDIWPMTPETMFLIESIVKVSSEGPNTGIL